MNSELREHVLLTVLGKDPKKACYSVKEEHAEAMLAPIALLDLLPETERPNKVLALCTPEAKRNSLEILEDALRGRCEVKPVEITASDTREGVNAFLTKVTTVIPENAELTVDVTHGFRHLSFLTYVAVLYVSVLRGIRIRGAYYGLFRPNEMSPFLDLRPLLELPHWVHALQVLNDTGSALSIAGIVNADSQEQVAQQIADHLTCFSEAYLSGLPLESGRHAAEFTGKYIKPLKKLLRNKHNLPLGSELADQIMRFFKPLTLASQISGNGWKRGVVLSQEELERQADVIDNLLRHRNVSAALGLMNEWTVSWAVWLRARESDWLDYHNVRHSAAGLLGAMAAVDADPDLRHVLTKDQLSLGAFWRRLTELRNGYAHHGMRPQVLVGDKQTETTLNDVQEYWTATLRSCPENFQFSLGDSPGGHVLVSPIGMRPGVLYSALHACRAVTDNSELSRCLVICSPETQGKIGEAAQHAGYEGPIEPLVIEDAFGGGSEEIKGLVGRARKHLIGVEAVLVNVTGGTTLMGLAAEAIANAGRALACPVRRFGLIDHRPPGEQDADPYQAGEPFWLDAPEGTDDGN